MTMTDPKTIDEWLTKNTHTTMAEAAAKLHYGPNEQAIAAGDWEKIKNSDPSYYAAIQTNLHQADSRGVERFAQEIVGNWIIEDIMLKLINEGKVVQVKCRLNGADKFRRLLSAKCVTEDPDYEVEIGGRVIRVELITDYSGWWKRHEVISLRDRKFNNLSKMNALVLCVDMSDRTFSVFDPANCSAAITTSPEWGNKVCMNVDCSGFGWMPLGPNAMCRALKDGMDAKYGPDTSFVYTPEYMAQERTRD